LRAARVHIDEYFMLVLNRLLWWEALAVMAGMTGDKQNSAFEVWLAAYGSHLERVAEGKAQDDFHSRREPGSVSGSAASDDMSGRDRSA
jgi:hypothetical protein